jgi:hypothetical protein
VVEPVGRGPQVEACKKLIEMKRFFCKHSHQLH